MEKRYIYVALTRTNTIMSKLIELIKKDEYTHAAISLDKNLSSMYSFGRKYTYNPFIGRFKKEELDKGIYNFQEVLPGAIIEIEITKEQYEKAQNILNHFILNSELYKYNYKGLINNLLKREEYRDDRFLCSEFVYYILQESGIVDLNLSRNLVTPQDLSKINGRIIYKGDLKLFQYRTLISEAMFKRLGA